MKKITLQKYIAYAIMIAFLAVPVLSVQAVDLGVSGESETQSSSETNVGLFGDDGDTDADTSTESQTNTSAQSLLMERVIAMIHQPMVKQNHQHYYKSTAMALPSTRQLRYNPRQI